MEPISTSTTNTDILVDLAAMMATLESLPDGALWLVGVLGLAAIYGLSYVFGKVAERFLPSKLLQQDQQQRVDLYGDGNGNKGRVMTKLESIEKKIDDVKDTQHEVNMDFEKRVSFLEGKNFGSIEAQKDG